MPAYNEFKAQHEDRQEEILITMAMQSSPSPHSPTSSNSSFGHRRQSEVGDYVKSISVTPRGLDPDNAKVYVVGDNDVDMNYGDREYLKARNIEHRRTDSMDTQPDNDDQAPYISKQLTAVIRDEIMNSKHAILSSSSDEEDHKEDDDDGDVPPFIQQQSVLIRQDSAQFYDQSLEEMGVEIHKKEEEEDEDEESGVQPNKSNEGWQSPTGYKAQDNDEDQESHQEDADEKYGAQYTDYSDGYNAEHETTYNGDHMMTLDGSNMLNVFSCIPYNENEYLPQELDESHDERIIPRFDIAKHLNEIIRFHWNGDALLSCDAIVIPVTEDWTPISSVSHMLMNSAGSQYLEHIYRQKKHGQYISTGCAECCVDSFNLPSKHIIHCAPPKYDDRYPVASENAMNSCYWQSLEIASDLNCKTIVFPSIYPPKFFSEQLAIHILARTVRRFLERYHESISFESIVICVESEQQMSIYTRIFTIYFPRDAIDLKYSAKYMPAYTGNACGGTVVKLRKQHIELSPLSGSVHEDRANQSSILKRRMPDYETYDIYGNLRASLQCMVKYKAEPEKIWKAQESKKWSWQKMEEAYQIKYKRYWTRCRKLNLKHIEMYQFVYVGGQDRDGRDIIIFVGNRFPAKLLMNHRKLKQSLLYIIRELHHIVDRDYIIVYLHSFVSEEENLPPISWITQCFQICKERFSKNLYQFYVIHANFRLKSWFYVLSTKSFYKNIVYLDSITKLEHHNIDLEHIALPGKSWEYEAQLFGEDKLADKMALATDDLVLDALPYR
eukprot:522445_1